MHVVAIHGLKGDATANAGALADVLGVTAYEARSRVQVPGGGPAVVSTFSTSAEAEALAGRLAAAGLPALAFDASIAAEVEAFPVRGFELDDAGLTVGTRDGQSTRLPWETIDLLVRGTSSVRETTREKVKERKFSAGRALATGGLIMRTSRESERVSTTTKTEGFVIAYSSVHAPVSLRDGALDYQSLGAAMQPSRAANFTYLTDQLRRRASAATLDDRLLRRAVQQQILGPSLNADDNLSLAIALIARGMDVMAAPHSPRR